MGELVESFGGKIGGELIRAADWNGMLAKVESLVGTLASTLGERIGQLEDRAADLEARVTGVEQRLTAAEPILSALRNRFRRLDLSAATTTFAIGQRGEIVARVAALDGSALDLSVAASRPWVDFVTVWGSLKAANGFVSRGGAGDQAVSVQVNAAGEARVLIRAAHAESFAEEEELEIEGFLSSRPQTGNASTIAQMVMNANTPRDAGLTFAYRAVSQEYDRSAASPPVVQRYLDSYYLLAPFRAAGNFSSVSVQRWRDYRATVLAFLKPDSDPTTADGALASASIQVSFRDWIAPWIEVDYLPHIPDLRLDYANRFRNLLVPDLGLAVDKIAADVNEIVRGKGVMGRQRDLLAVDQAVGTMRFDGNPPSYMPDLVQAVQFGTQMQHAMIYSQAVTPGAGAATKGFEAMAGSAVKATAEAGRVQRQLTEEMNTRLADAGKSLIAEVEVSQSRFEDKLLGSRGVIVKVQEDMKAFSGTIEGMRADLKGKAGTEMIANIVGSFTK